MPNFTGQTQAFFHFDRGIKAFFEGAAAEVVAAFCLAESEEAAGVEAAALCCFLDSSGVAVAAFYLAEAAGVAAAAFCLADSAGIAFCCFLDSAKVAGITFCLADSAKVAEAAGVAF